MLSLKQKLFPLIYKISNQSNNKMFNLECIHTTSNFILNSWESFEKIKLTGSAFTNLFILCWGHFCWKWYKMEEILAACKHNGYDRIWLKKIAHIDQTFSMLDSKPHSQLGRPNNWFHRSMFLIWIKNKEQSVGFLVILCPCMKINWIRLQSKCTFWWQQPFSNLKEIIF